jgi:hypothetical protein
MTETPANPFIDALRQAYGDDWQLEYSGHLVAAQIIWDAALRAERAHVDARLRAAERDAARLRELLEKWTYDGCLQTFENRELFRKEARAALAGSAQEEGR